MLRVLLPIECAGFRQDRRRREEEGPMADAQGVCVGMYNVMRRFHVRRQMKRRVQDDRNQGRGVRGDVGIQTMAESLETHLAAPRRRRRYSVGQSARAHVDKRLNGRV